MAREPGYTYAFRNALGHELKEARRRKRLTIDEVAERVSAASSTQIKGRCIQTYESASRHVTVERLDHICDALGVDMVVLLQLARQRVRTWNLRQQLAIPEQ